MKRIRYYLINRISCIALVLLLMGAFTAAANAQCFGSFSNILRAAALAKDSAKSVSPDVRSKVWDTVTGLKPSGKGVNPSIVGFWHVHYLFPDMDQEAYQTFETGGTEIHNPNTPTDGVCLGAWAAEAGNTVKLTHRVWLYDNGNFVGVGHLNATISLGDRGNSQSGTFTLQIFDLSGNAITPPIPGTLSGERIVPN